MKLRIFTFILLLSQTQIMQAMTKEDILQLATKCHAESMQAHEQVNIRLQNALQEMEEVTTNLKNAVSEYAETTEKTLERAEELDAGLKKLNKHLNRTQFLTNTVLVTGAVGIGVLGYLITTQK